MNEFVVCIFTGEVANKIQTFRMCLAEGGMRPIPMIGPLLKNSFVVFCFVFLDVGNVIVLKTRRQSALLPQLFVHHAWLSSREGNADCLK